MGYGRYSTDSRSLRSRIKNVVKLASNDLDQVKACLSDAGVSFASTGSNLTLAEEDMSKVQGLLAGHGLSASFSELDARLSGYAHRSGAESFQQRQINNAMNPYGVRIRESRDSVEHPNSVAIVLGLDETGSMGSVPHYLVKEGLPLLMERIIKGGVPDPQVLFLGIGDHECDNAPLQVGQFESSDELLDKWLTDLYLEGRGGGNAGESYLLAWYFAAYHTAIDCWEKRQKKGYCITIGDEPVLPRVPASFLRHLMGDGQYEDYTALDLISKASEKYHVYHINVQETASGSRREVAAGWRQLLADNFLVAPRREVVSQIVSDIILNGELKSQGQIAQGLAAPTKAEEILL